MLPKHVPLLHESPLEQSVSILHSVNIIESINKAHVLSSYAYRVRKTTNIVTFTQCHAYSAIISIVTYVWTIYHLLRGSIRRVNNCVKPSSFTPSMSRPIASCWLSRRCDSSIVRQTQQIRGNFASAFGRYNVTIRAVLTKLMLAINVGLSCKMQLHITINAWIF